MATNDRDKPLDTQIRNTTANMAITLTKVHNLQIEVQSLRADIRSLAALFVKLLPPDERADFAEMVRKDNLTQKSGLTNPDAK